MTVALLTIASVFSGKDSKNCAWPAFTRCIAYREANWLQAGSVEAGASPEQAEAELGSTIPESQPPRQTFLKSGLQFGTSAGEESRLASNSVAKAAAAPEQPAGLSIRPFKVTGKKVFGTQPSSTQPTPVLHLLTTFG